MNSPATETDRRVPRGLADELALDQAQRLSDKDFRRVADYMEATAGIHLAESKRYLAEGRLNKRRRLLGYADFTRYLDFALNDPAGRAEAGELLDALTTNKTDFYREREHFQFLQNEIIEPLALRREVGWTRPLRIWSAACSSGEEPYTLAIEMREAQRRHPGFQFEIVASDISLRSLRTAKQAIYPLERIEPVPEEYRRRYFLRGVRKSAGLIQMGEELREPVQFGVFNLLSGNFNSLGLFDVIFCRNAMIYFNPTDRLNIIRRFSSALTTEGYFFVGHSESLNGICPSMAQQIPTVYRKKRPGAV